MSTTTLTTIHSRLRELTPGIMVSLVLAIAATFLSEHYHAPVMLLALLLGMSLNFLCTEAKCKPGIEFSARTVLRIGVALLRMRITLEQMTGMGWKPAALVMILVVATIGVSVIAARALGFKRTFGLLTGGRNGNLWRLGGTGPGSRAPKPPAKGTRNTVHRHRCIGAVDPGDDSLSDDCHLGGTVTA